MVRNESSAQLLKSGKKIKILNWNVQYMAGKNCVFYYDLPGFAGPDERPTTADINATFDRIVEVVKKEDPDIVLLQEIDTGAKRTDYEDQISRLKSMLPGDYVSSSSSYYWKAAFVPHPRIMGKVGMKLVTISKYKMSSAKRYQLPQIPADLLSKQFGLKRCILETVFPMDNGKKFVVLNTHLDAFAQGTNTMQKQVEKISQLLDFMTQEGLPWIIGGDFNLLPPGQFELLAPYERQNFVKPSELIKLTDKYSVFPTVEDATGQFYKNWFTQFPNDPKISFPNKTIDYIFVAENVKIDSGYVRNKDTLDISDHLPVIISITVP
jgi:endonuclease/exonuclease/phosphatase family metal-dependent hydrolase